MKRTSIGVGTVFGLALLTSALAFAGATEYEFQPVKVEVKSGPQSQLAVRLVHKATGKSVEGAVLVQTRLDMSPESMDEMTAKHTAAPITEPGVYAFTANLTMAGGWAFKIQAKVPGEGETITGTIIFRAQ